MPRQRQRRSSSLLLATLALGAVSVTHADKDKEKSPDKVKDKSDKEILNQGLECHTACWPGELGEQRTGDQRSSGRCATDFCGAGACCRRGLVQEPCDGKIGCAERQCCTKLPKVEKPPPMFKQGPHSRTGIPTARRSCPVRISGRP